MKRVLIIGIDSLDRSILARLGDNLPNFAKLRRTRQDIRLESVFPPDSPTCWASIYTGLNPSNHGIVSFVEPLSKITEMVSQEVDNSNLPGKTFWDIAGSSGKRVCAILPVIGYPVWPVNGIMVGRSSIKNDIQTFPQSLSQNYTLPQLNSIKYFPVGRRAKEFLTSSQGLTLSEAEFGLKLLRSNQWDLFFISLVSLDAIQGFFWNYWDEDDPTYPGDNSYRNTIRDFHYLLDEILGKFLNSVDANTVVIVVSDHGMGMRPIKLLNINELLREKGLLTPRYSGLKRGGPLVVSLMEKAKRATSQFIAGHGYAASLATRILRSFPASRTMYTSPISINWGKTVAYFTDLSGIKAYSYGGINIKRESLDNQDYEEVRHLIIEELSKVEDPNTGQRIVKWVCRREELYSGEYIPLYPDIVFYLEEDYGGGWAIYDSLINISPTHKIVSGSHRPYQPVFLMSSLSDKEIIRQNMVLVDVAPTILDILDIKGDFNFDGKSIFK